MLLVAEPSRFLCRVREAILVRHFSIRTEEAYVYWVKRLFYSTGNVIRRKWVRRKPPRCWRISRWNGKSPRPHRIKLSARWCFYIETSWDARWRVCRHPSARSGCR